MQNESAATHLPSRPLQAHAAAQKPGTPHSSSLPLIPAPSSAPLQRPPPRPAPGGVPEERLPVPRLPREAARPQGSRPPDTTTTNLPPPPHTELSPARGTGPGTRWVSAVTGPGETRSPLRRHHHKVRSPIEKEEEKRKAERKAGARWGRRVALRRRLPQPVGEALATSTAAPPQAPARHFRVEGGGGGRQAGRRPFSGARALRMRPTPRRAWAGGARRRPRFVAGSARLGSAQPGCFAPALRLPTQLGERVLDREPGVF